MTKVLIVDDNETNLYMLNIFLTGHGYEVIQAKDGQEALDAARRSDPDLIISGHPDAGDGPALPFAGPGKAMKICVASRSFSTPPPTPIPRTRNSP